MKVRNGVEVREVRPSHVAILVPSVEKASAYLRELGFSIGPVEIFEGEGTREVYVEYGKDNALLLMEPLASGPYRRAMEKRGPGVHHLALDVKDLEGFVESVSGSGWLLHPRSLQTIKASRTAYLARPGFPALIEVQEKKVLERSEIFVTRVSLPMSASGERLISALQLSEIVRISQVEASLELSGKTVLLSELL